MSIVNAFTNGHARSARSVAELLERRGSIFVYPLSVMAADNRLFFLAKTGGGRRLGVLSPDGIFDGPHERVWIEGEQRVLELCPVDAQHAAALRKQLTFLVPRVLGLAASIGCGDRLGLATPGHVRAVRKHRLAPVFAQQSIREMSRTGRSPQQVVDDAMWGAFQEGWASGFGADADHLKTPEDVDRCVEAGYTLFTIDPSDYVDDGADEAGPASLQRKIEALPWSDLEITFADLRRRYSGRIFRANDFTLELNDEVVARAAAKYGGAVAHTVLIYRHLKAQMGDRPFELEMSVDETESATSADEHFYVASELNRLGVEWVSLAPRFVGRMEKAVEYAGDFAAFSASLARHVAIARELGPYKLSLHSGSDKFGLYPIFARESGDLLHVKTAGTSYLESLRTIASTDPTLFRTILELARDNYHTDKATYHVSADCTKVPAARDLADNDLPTLLDQFDARQVLHVTFGTVLSSELRPRMLEMLQENEETYFAMLEHHFDRHLDPFG